MSLPKGGGAVGGIGEKFSANPVNGTGALTVPLALSPGRAGFGPGLELRYDSGAGNGIFGLGWQLGLPAIARRTDKGLPRYLDDESDVFVLAGGEDLVPADGGRSRARTYGHDYDVVRYRPRIDGLGMLVERWTAAADRTDVFWRTIDRDNVTSWYGRTPESRVVDPADAGRIFQWSICERHDDKGNAVEYGYAREDARRVDWSAPNEAHRTPTDLTANTYLKRARYGNTRPFLPPMGAEATAWATADLVPDQAWMFEVVLDYGDHTTDPTGAPVPTPDRPWTVRADPFSAHRAGFEVRTLRLCRRVLMFHHFPDDPAVGADCLVRSTDLDYREPTRPDDPEQPGYTVLSSVVHRSYRRRTTAAGPTTGYDHRQRPPLTFAYSEPRIDPTVRTLPPESLADLPGGTHGGGSGPGHRWVDLDGEGLSGVLAEEGGAWWYTPNRGDGRFGPTRRVAEVPAMADLAGGDQQLVDLTGGGTLALVDLAPPNPGFHRRQPDGDPSGNGNGANGHGWTGFHSFRQVPNVDADDPQLRFVDLTGDGRGDVLITEDEVVTWYPSQGEDGYGEARTAPGPGPRLVFADGTETVFLADMSGDGLTDLVRVRNHDVSYWPNQGFGAFGPKVALANTRGFDRDDLYDPRRIRLADVDGSGPADVLYLASDGARLYYNRSGNGLSDPAPVPLPLPTATTAGNAEIAGVQVADLLGDGTACLVASSPLPADAGTGRQVRYVALMADGKPHLLTGVDNNLGGTTEIEYAPSTRFFLQDQRDGSPWVTRLPFPVHCVSRVTWRDKWRGTAFSSTYSYHHGFYDGDERELRGFGRVEQVDVEDFGTFAAGNPDSPFVTPDRSLYQPPVKTVTWYDVGAARERDRLAARYAREAFPARHRVEGFAEKAPDTAANAADAPSSGDLADDEWREAARARKGRVLRQEVYELDVDELAGPAHRQRPVRLWSVATRDHRVERLQPRGTNRHAVFLATEREALTYQHDLALPAPGATAAVTPDPRIEHTLNLRHDDLGNVVQAVAVGYGRLRPGLPAGVPATVPHPERIVAAQAELHATYTEVRHTGDVQVRGPADTTPAPPGTTASATAVRHHRTRLVAETRTYELTGLTVPASGYLDVAALRRHALCEDGRYPPTPGAPGQPPDPVAAVAYHEQPPATGVGRRLVQHAVSLYRRDEDGVAQPSAPHPRGTHGPRGTKHEDHTLALTRSLLDAVFDTTNSGGDLLARPLRPGGPPVGDLLDDPATSGYVPGTALDPAWTDQLWTASGRAGFTRAAAETFYVPEAFTDPFGHTTTQRHDAQNLFVETTTDPVGNVTRVAGFDRRVLSARELVDPNGNRSEVAFDLLGRVVALATRGKPGTGGTGGTGDGLAGLTADLLDPDEADVQAFCVATTFDEATARTWLDDATSRFVQHFGEHRDPVTGTVTWADRMAGACAVHRSHHVATAGPAGGSTTPRLEVALECSDGSGTILMTKVRAEPELPGSPVRWVVQGRTVVNNKGKPVKQYEPAFTADFGAQLPPAEGVAPVMSYDAAGRLVRTDHPDGTVERVEPTPWVVRTFDRNDTVLESAWYTTRDQLDPAQPLPRDLAGVVTADPDQRAGWLAARHAGTPALSLLDSRGRPVVEVVHDRVEDPAGPHTYDGRTWRDVHHAGHTRLDAEGRTLWVRDARGVLAVQHLVPPRPGDAPDDDLPAGTVPGYDIAGNLLFQHGADSGSRWTLPDAAGEPLLTWDVNDRPTTATGTGPRTVERRLSLVRRDALRRPVEQWLRIDDADPVLIEAADHADTTALAAAGTAALDDARARNLIGQRVRHYDTGGLATVERLDADGAVEEVTRALVADPTAELTDWDVADRTALLAEAHRRITEHDARGRPTTVYEWHRDRPGEPGRSDRVAVRAPRYNERGLLAAEDLHLRATKQTAADGTRRFTPGTTPDAGRNPAAIADVTWDAKGRKLVVELGDGTTTEHTYDPATFRLVHLATRRSTSTSATADVQDLRFTYDPVGNVTHLRDDAQDTIWFANQQVEPSRDFAYDGLDRLTGAEGRESTAATGAPPHPAGPWPRGAMPSNDATRRFTERYRYDAVGNLLRVRHEASGANWTRNHEVAADGNRLVRTWFGTGTWDATPGAQRTEHRHDLHGNLLNLASTAPALDLRWDRRDMVATVDLFGGGLAHLQHDLDGERTRKRIENGGTVEERIALGGHERYRRWVGSTLVEDVESTHIELDDQRVLLVDDVLLSDDAATDDRTVLRYQHADHLGSVGTELDGDARVIGHEEHHPYGTSAYRRTNAAVAAPPRRYRYTGAERDDETGLDHHGARYYAPGLGRWASCDPDGLADGPNVYAYCRGNPVRRTDPGGRASDDKTRQPAPPPQPAPQAQPQAPAKTRDYLGVPAAVANELIEGMVWNKWFGPGGRNQAVVLDGLRGKIIDRLAGNNLGLNQRLVDKRIGDRIIQIKSFLRERNEVQNLISTVRSATRDAAEYIRELPRAQRLRRLLPQAQIVLPSWARATLDQVAKNALNGAGAAKQVWRSLPRFALPPIVTRGVPGFVGSAARVLQRVAVPLLALGLGSALHRGDTVGVIDNLSGLVPAGLGAFSRFAASRAAPAALGSLAPGAARFGHIAAAFAAGWTIGRLVDEHVLSEQTRNDIGGTLNQIVNEGGWRDTANLRNPFGLRTLYQSITGP